MAAGDGAIIAGTCLCQLVGYWSQLDLMPATTDPEASSVARLAIAGNYPTIILFGAWKLRGIGRI